MKYTYFHIQGSEIWGTEECYGIVVARYKQLCGGEGGTGLGIWIPNKNNENKWSAPPVKRPDHVEQDNQFYGNEYAHQEQLYVSV